MLVKHPYRPALPPSHIYCTSAFIVLEYHLIVQIEIGYVSEERNRAQMDQHSHRSTLFIVVGFGCDLLCLGDFAEFGRHVEVRYYDLMLIIVFFVFLLENYKNGECL